MKTIKRDGRPSKRPWRSRAAMGLAAVALTAPAGLVTASAQDPTAGVLDVDPIVPVDTQVWADQAEMTWDDYTPVRPAEWNADTTSTGSESQYRTAVILLDFTDEEFLITQEAETHPFGNPLPPWAPLPREDLADWFYDYYAVPNEYNKGQTLHGYWMETSHGRIGVTVEVFGPYKLPGKLHEYGLSGFAPVTGPNSTCPAGDVCNKDIRNHGAALWRADIGCTSGLCGFDNGFYVTAGHDETSTWQEFGEMMFRTPADVPAEFGPPGATEGPVLNAAGNPIPNAVDTRYVDWTSWRSAANHWPNAGSGTSTQAENSGLSVYAHEFSHLRGLPDNYNNPFDQSTGRSGTAYWEMMSRGSFNGPGGTHNRWQVPNAGGSALGPHHTLHFKTVGPGRLGVVTNDEQVELSRADLTAQGVAVLPIKARSSVPNGDKVGLTVNLGSPFIRGACEARVEDQFFCTPIPNPNQPSQNWHKFTMEVVDRVGNDSFVAGHGVLLSQVRQSAPSLQPRVWLVDAVPEDIGRIDFYRPGNATEPGGEAVPVGKGDPRQIDDATFHAGTDSGSEFEYLDAPNRLHFYILDTYRDSDGALFYDVAVRSTDGAGPAVRDVALADAAPFAVGGGSALVNVPLTNTGQAGTGIFGSDVYRISSTVDGDGWEVSLPYEVKSAAAGKTVPVWAYATAGDGASEVATVTVTATSESNPAVTETVTVELKLSDLDAGFDSASGLLDAYLDGGLLSRSEYQRMSAQLNIAETASGRAPERALDRFTTLADDVAGTGARSLVSAALVSVATELREDI